jgi:2,3-bisphosphoglycerate-dependent phosphoglycerate mutase
MTEIILIRHGQTVWNTERRMQGHSDSPLTEKGLRQAQLLAKHMAGLSFDALYSSDTGRAQETARCVAAATGHSLNVEPRLRERNFGVFEGLTRDEMIARYPDDYARFKSRDQHFAMPRGESGVAFRARAIACMDEIIARYPQQQVAIVTHGLVLDVFYRLAMGIPPEEPRIHELVNAGINRLRHDGSAWQIIVWGDASHLEEGMRTVA